MRSCVLATKRFVGYAPAMTATGRFVKAGTNMQQRRTLFIDTETTPNPQSLKFIPGREVLPESSGTGMYFQRNQDSGSLAKSPLAKVVFQIKGVKGIFLGREFMTVTKMEEEAWSALKPQIFSKMLDFFAEGKPVVDDRPVVSDTAVLDTDDEIVATIKELLETRVRPSVQEDGGDIFYAGFDAATGIVKVRLAGSCVGCPSSSVTLRNGVENMLMHYIPEVKGIEDVGQVGDDSEPEPTKLEFRPESA